MRLPVILKTACWSRPIAGFQTPILHGFGNVFGGDGRRFGPLGHGAGDFADAAMRVGGEVNPR